MTVGPVWPGRGEPAAASESGSGWAASLSAASRRVIGAEAEAAFERAATNPATPSVYNEALLAEVLRHEAAAGREVGLLLADSNNLSDFNEAMGMAGGDEAIDRTSEVYNRAAAALNWLHEGEGLRFVPGRKAGDEMYMLAVLDPAGGTTRVSPVVVREMVRVVNDEIAAFNARSAVPIPTATSAAAVVRPDQHGDGFGLAALLDRIDSVGVSHVNGVPRGASWFKNAGAVVTDAVLAGAAPEVLPGPVYALPQGAVLRGFRAWQGGLPQLSQAYQSGQPNVVIATPEVRAARPWLLPTASSTQATGRVPLPPHLVRGLAWGGDDGIGTLNRQRALEPIESVFRPLLGDGVRVLNQPAGLERLGMLLGSVRPGETLALEFLEPRGLKEINDRGFVRAGERIVPVSHGGGNRAVEEMLRATHRALEQVFGAGYDDRGDAFVFRDRTKRFGVTYGPAAGRAEIEAVQQERSALYRATPPRVRLDGQEHPILMPDGGAGRALVFRVAAAALRLEPRAAPLEGMTAETLRELLVAPPYPGGQSALELAKALIDGVAVPAAGLPSPGRGMELVIMTERRTPPGAL